MFTHEMDAVVHMEWRLLFFLGKLPDPSASTLFVALHLPLFFAFFYFGHHESKKIRQTFRVIVAAFLLVHGALHLGLSGHELYRFEGVISSVYISVAAICGAAYLILAWMHRGRSDT